MIKAIETKWKGYRFRSRLEARWAVFFERLGWRWEYEPQGFEKDGVRYLPDFLVHPTDKLSYWVEVKGDPKWLKENKGNLDQLHDFGGILPGFCDSGISQNIPNGLVILGEVPEPNYGVWYFPIIGHHKGVNLYWRAIVPEVGFIELSQVLQLHTGLGADFYGLGGLGEEDLEFQAKLARTPRGYHGVYEAVAAARSARFEHGEVPV